MPIRRPTSAGRPRDSKSCCEFAAQSRGADHAEGNVGLPVREPETAPQAGRPPLQLTSTRPPITTADLLSDGRLRLERGEVAIESIAHTCFRIHSDDGRRILIDPYASRVWLGYDFPRELATDAILITHPHFDHDGGEFIGRTVPWTPETRVLRDPGTFTVADFHITGIGGKHADPWGQEFGQKNTM